MIKNNIISNAYIAKIKNKNINDLLKYQNSINNLDNIQNDVCKNNSITIKIKKSTVDDHDDNITEYNKKHTNEYKILLLNIENKKKELDDINKEIETKNFILNKLTTKITDKQKYLYELLININEYDNVDCENICYNEVLNDVVLNTEYKKDIPLISVITVLSDEKDILDIIDSFNEKYSNLNLEHTLVNVSNNNYDELIKTYINKTNYKINYLSISNKFTYMDGLNTGVLKSRGTFITFMKLSNLYNSDVMKILPCYSNYDNVIISGINKNIGATMKKCKIINKQLFMNNLNVNMEQLIFSKNIINTVNLVNDQYKYAYLYNFCVNCVFNNIKYIVDNRIVCNSNDNEDEHYYMMLVEQLFIIKTYYNIVHKKLISVLVDKLFPDAGNNIIGDNKKFIIYKYVKNLNLNCDIDVQKNVVELLNIVKNNDYNKCKDILIIGNGPSAKQLSFEKVNNMDTLGMNAAYRYWKKINWYPTYYACLDDKVILSHAEEIYNLIIFSPIKLFFLHDNIKDIYNNLENNNKIIFLSDVFNNTNVVNNNLSEYDIFRSTYLTTGAFSIRFMILLGYKNIYTTGIDCNYVNIIDGSILIDKIKMTIKYKPDNNPNYFFNDYQLPGDIYNIPNPCNYNNIHQDAINGIYDYVNDKNINVNIYKLSNINENIKFKYYDIVKFNDLFVDHSNNKSLK